MKILALDFETGKHLCSTFSVWQANIPHTAIIKHGGLLMGSYSYIDPAEGTYTVPENISLLDFQKGKVDVWDDSKIAKAFYKICSDVDAIVAHNGDAFDLKKLNTSLILNNLPALPTINSIDTLKIARRNFSFAHNRLDAIGDILGLGRKSYSDPRWWDALANPFESSKTKRAILEEMSPYCDQDVELLAEVYFALRNFDKNHPSFNLVSSEEDACPTCGNVGTLKTNPSWVHKAKTRAYPRYKCGSCDSWCRGTKSIGKVNFRSI